MSTLSQPSPKCLPPAFLETRYRRNAVRKRKQTNRHRVRPHSSRLSLKQQPGRHKQLFFQWSASPHCLRLTLTREEVPTLCCCRNDPGFCVLLPSISIARQHLNTETNAK
ncbi:hypothetical protein AVEN_106449-1 [Araneus ventricosus]|uniref:Uncharacterized protein n=1 Tax=Araneus ventricosus TaxID=182803 RepID=A0A4Y2AUJ9_ARAVE|nr:hypothetical protein AVEN_106449-1 [Araneus ventricosus]